MINGHMYSGVISLQFLIQASVESESSSPSMIIITRIMIVLLIICLTINIDTYYYQLSEGYISPDDGFE